MRRFIGGSAAFLVLTGTLLVLPVYAAPLPGAEPVEASIATVELGSVEAPAPAADVAPAAEVQPEVVGTVPVDAPVASEPVAADDPVLLISRPQTEQFSAVGVTWAASDGVTGVQVRLRTIEADGSWSEWTDVQQDDIEQTDSAETDAAGVRGGTAPYWTGESTGVEAQVTTTQGTQPTDVQLQLVDPGTSAADSNPGAPQVQDVAHAAATMPAIYSRAQWGADESIRTWDPEYAPTIRAATLHHTADGNNYSAAQVPAMMRSIYAFHTQSRGWGDIGYNVIVDKYGRAWEGRYGGLASTVIGAHAGGFNTGTFGVSMLGNYAETDTPAAMLETVADVIAWKLSLYGVNPRGTTQLTSGGGGTAKYAAGTVVTLPTIFAHRDVGSTTCPGQYAYNRMGQLRDMVAARMATVAGDPRGSLDAVRMTGSSFEATGWAFDPDAPTSPAVVSVRVDGQLIGSRVASGPRPDVAAAYPAAGPAHGYSIPGTLTNGNHTICLYAENVAGPGTSTALGCKTVAVTNRAPVANLEVVTEGVDGSVRIAGWAYDPDAPQQSLELHVYDNGSGRALRADVSRPDVRAAYGVGERTGFDVSLPALSGRHEICAYAIDASGGANTAVLCRLFDYAAPLGSVDVIAETTSGSVRVAGWMYDPSTPTASIGTHVYVDGRGTALTADVVRSDIAAAVPGAGAAHGFDVDLALSPGQHQVCVFGINTGIGGPNRLFLCQTVTLAYQAPRGSVDVIAAAGSGRVRVGGWAVDPSTPTAPVTVHYYVDGRYASADTAAGARPDIAAAVPGAGAGHGYDATLTVGAGSHSVCVFALNTGVPGANVLMRCQTLTV